jgi:7-cyano-7-deazaguanine synthase
MSAAVVLLSSGLDSTVNLYRAQRDMEIRRVLTVDYGQRAARREIAQSQQISKNLGLQHEVIELPWLRALTQTSLVNESVEVPTGASIEMDNLRQSFKTAKAVWVPNRNGIFLNIAAAVAESVGAEFVIPGFNIEEAATFPDNTQAFLNALDTSFSFSTSSQVKTKCYTTVLDKTQIASMGRELEAPFDLMWPCYFGGEMICGECESCQRFLRATKGNL